MSDKRILVLIPARMASTRLPGKPLHDIAGLPMIVHVLRRAEAARIGRVAVATDTTEIAEAVRAHGGEAVMTSADHPSGSDRVAGDLVHQVNDWYSGAAANFGWVREAKWENTRCGL